MKTIKLVREYWDRRPCNIRHSLEPVGTKAYFDEVENRKYFVEPHIPEFAEFHKWQGKNVLEKTPLQKQAKEELRKIADFIIEREL